MDQYEEIQTFNKLFFIKVAMKIAVVAVALFGAAAAIGVVWYYRDLNDRKISFEEAKKVGNWELLDDNYVFQSAFKLKMFDSEANSVEIKDERSGNEINILGMSREFSDAHLKFDVLRSDEDKSNDELFMDFYSPENYAVRGTGKVEDGRAELYYNYIENKGYTDINDKVEGILGRIDCTNDVIVVLITNKGKDKFDSGRAFDFAKILSCQPYDSGLKTGKENTVMPADSDGKVSTDSTENRRGSSESPEDSPKETENTPTSSNNAETSPAPELPALSEPAPSADANANSPADSQSQPVAPDSAKTSPDAGTEEKVLVKGEDSDNDGLSNNTEFVIGTDLNKTDTDADGFSDFDEVKSAFNPTKHSPGDAYSAEDFTKIKERIKAIDEENYNRLFPK